ncbi:hypothetical protein T12_11106, partial [Trichinella patagoniensis]
LPWSHTWSCPFYTYVLSQEPMDHLGSGPSTGSRLRVEPWKLLTQDSIVP